MQYLVSQPGAPTLRFNYDEWTSLLQPHGPLPADLHFNHDATAARHADCWTFDVSYDAIRGAGNELPPFRVAVRNVRRGRGDARRPWFLSLSLLVDPIEEASGGVHVLRHQSILLC